MWACVCVCICGILSMCSTHTHPHTHTPTYTCKYSCIYAYTYRHIYSHPCICLCIYAYVYTHVSIYLYPNTKMQERREKHARKTQGPLLPGLERKMGQKKLPTPGTRVCVYVCLCIRVLSPTPGAASVHSLYCVALVLWKNLRILDVPCLNISRDMVWLRLVGSFEL